MAVIFITHDMGVVAEIADRVVVMWQRREGRGRRRASRSSPRRGTRTRARCCRRCRGWARCAAPTRRAKFPLLAVDGTAAAPPPQRAGGRRATAPEPRQRRSLLRVRGLTTRFDVRGGFLGRVRRRVHAVEQVSFDLAAGETLALVGESGCGKSTTGRSLLRLVDIAGGSIEFDGRDIARLPASEVRPVRRDIQMIFQDPFASLDPRLTVGFSIAEPLYVHGVASGSAARGPRRLAAAARRPVARPRAALSARVLRRPAAAHRHRPRAGAQPEDHRRRRGGVGARRLDPGADRQPAARPAGRVRALATCSSRTTWRWSSGSATASR